MYGEFRLNYTTERVANGWLSPDGRVYPCVPTRHWALAKEIVQTFGLDRRRNPTGDRRGDPEQLLECLNWVKLKDGIFHYETTLTGGVTQKQFDAIWDFYQDKRHPAFSDLVVVEPRQY